MTTDYDILSAVRRITYQLDQRGNAALNGLPELLCRALKVQEEAGELAQAVIGVLGQNPRKGVTDTWEHVTVEAIDVALSALVFAYTVANKRTEIPFETLLTARLAYLYRRAEQSGAPTPPPDGLPPQEGR